MIESFDCEENYYWRYYNDPKQKPKYLINKMNEKGNEIARQLCCLIEEIINEK